MNGQREQIVSFLQKILLGNGRISSVDFDGEYLEISTKDGKTVRLTIPEKEPESNMLRDSGRKGKVENAFSGMVRCNPAFRSGGVDKKA